MTTIVSEPVTAPAINLDEPIIRAGPARDARQRLLVPPKRLAEVSASVIGVGAVGRQVALQLAAMGVPSLALFDHDRVEEVNLAPQMYCRRDLDEFKVRATGRLCQELAPLDSNIAMVPSKFLPSHVRGLAQEWHKRDGAIFCCVDSIETRREIWERVKGHTAVFVDTRCAAEVVRVLASDNPPEDEEYAKTLFTAAEAYQGSCTARMTVYVAALAASLAVAQFARWLRGVPTEPDMTMNLLGAELTLGEE